MNGLLLIQALRPDRLTAMARVFVEKSLGSTFLHSGEKELNLSGIVENEVIILSYLQLKLIWKSFYDVFIHVLLITRRPESNFLSQN